MEAMGIMGFMTGAAAMTFALSSMAQISALKKELAELKESLNSAGVIPSAPESEE